VLYLFLGLRSPLVASVASLWFVAVALCFGFSFPLFFGVLLCFLFFVFLLVDSSRFFCLRLLLPVVLLVGWVLFRLVVGCVLVSGLRLAVCLFAFRLVLCRLSVCRSVSVWACGLISLTVCLSSLRLGIGFVLRGLLRLVTLLCVSSVAGVLSRSWSLPWRCGSTSFLT